MTRLILLVMVPLFANGESQGVLGREEVSVFVPLTRYSYRSST